jgi:hypothetical protein
MIDFCPPLHHFLSGTSFVLSGLMKFFHSSVCLLFNDHVTFFGLFHKVMVAGTYLQANLPDG